jgi:hypothetical protein
VVRLRSVLGAVVVAAGALAAAAAPAGAATSTTSGTPSTFASAISIDKVNHTVTLPLFEGSAPGRGTVWFILTESSDFNDAVNRGINWSPKLVNALGTAAIQQATLLGGGGHSAFNQNSIVQFSGGVDFSGTRVVVPGPDLFPLDPASHAGPVADPAYSPLFTFGDG